MSVSRPAKEPSPDDAERLARAADAYDTARDERRKAALDAWRAGASIPQVAKHARLSTRTLQDWIKADTE